MELLIPAGVSILILEAEQRDQLPLVALFTLLPIGAIFLTASRGGIVSFIAEMGFLAVLVFLRRREKKALVATAVFAGLAMVLVSWLGIGVALDRFAGTTNIEVTEGRRVSMLYGSLRIFRDYPVLGTGLGTLQEVFPRYDPVYDGKVVNHSHNDYAEALAETGALGGICFFSFLGLLFWMGLKILVADRDPRNLAYHAGALVACFGLLVHGLVDFNFHIPSNALLFLTQAALATCALPPRSERMR
jgi:O-antigen ligase